MSAAVISHVRVAASHDGATELVVTLRHDNGGLTEVILDELGAAALFEACGGPAPEDLLGHGWEKVQGALAASWNRFANTHAGGFDSCTT